MALPSREHGNYVNQNAMKIQKDSQIRRILGSINSFNKPIMLLNGSREVGRTGALQIVKARPHGPKWIQRGRQALALQFFHWTKKETQLDIKEMTWNEENESVFFPLIKALACLKVCIKHLSGKFKTKTR